MSILKIDPSGNMFRIKVGQIPAGRYRYVIGFVGNAPKRKWDGHVVCTSSKFLIDASLFHFHKELGLEIPWVGAVQRIPVPSQMMARHELSSDTTLKWLYPPPGSDTHYPEVPQSLVQELAGSLTSTLGDGP